MGRVTGIEQVVPEPQEPMTPSGPTIRIQYGVGSTSALAVAVSVMYRVTHGWMSLAASETDHVNIGDMTGEPEGEAFLAGRSGPGIALGARGGGTGSGLALRACPSPGSISPMSSRSGSGEPPHAAASRTAMMTPVFFMFSLRAEVMDCFLT